MAAHHDAKKRAHNQEHGIVGSQTGKDLRQREESYIDHQRQAAPVTIRHQPEDESSDRAKSKSHGDDQGDLRIGLVEVPRHGRQAESYEKEIEGVQQPPGKAGYDCRSMSVRDFALRYTLQPAATICAEKTPWESFGGSPLL